MVSSDEARVLVASLFISALVTSNLTASKIVSINFPLIGSIMFPAAVLAYAVTFLFTDIYAEIWGKKAAAKLVLYGFFANIFILFLVEFAIYLPPAPFHIEYQKVYSTVLGFTPNIIIASMIAYIISQNHDVWAFHFWRKVTNGAHLWLRNNASTLVSQLIDTVLFITLAFYILPLAIQGEPIIPLESIATVIFGQYLVKAIIALCDTPFCYLGVMLIQKGLRIKELSQLKMQSKGK